jgi:hypothetical protein
VNTENIPVNGCMKGRHFMNAAMDLAILSFRNVLSSVGHVLSLFSPSRVHETAQELLDRFS